jgi:hypothetical protein
LIVTHALDDHVPRVEAELKRRGADFVRFDTDFCFQSSSADFAIDAGRLCGAFVIGSEEYRSDSL